MRRVTILGLIALMAGLLIAAGLIPANEALAATINVNTFDDEYDASKGPGDCSLREAVISANRNIAVDGCEQGSGVGTDVIFVPAGLYELTISGIEEDEAETGDLDITESISFIAAPAPSVSTLGNGPATPVIDAGGEIEDADCFGNDISTQGFDEGIDRVFHVLPESQPTAAAQGNGTLVDASFSDLTIRGGAVFGDSVPGGGGILAQQAALHLTNVNVQENIAIDEEEFSITQGGGIGLFEGSTLEMSNSAVGSNVAFGYGAIGGGIGDGEIPPDSDSNSELRRNIEDASSESSVLGDPVPGVDISDSQIEGNLACGLIGSGGGVSVIQESQFINTDIQNNQAAGLGIGLGGGLSQGGIFLTVSAADQSSLGPGGPPVVGPLLFDRGVVSDNQALAFGDDTFFGSSSAAGGGFLGTAETAFTKSTIQNNTALAEPEEGPDVFSEGGGVGHVFGDLTLSQSTVADNLSSAPAPTPTAAGEGSALGGPEDAGTGGGVAIVDSSGEIRNSTISGNEASDGAGLLFESRGSDGGGGGAGAQGGTQGSPLDVVFSTITDNSANGTGGAAVLTRSSNDPGDLNLRASIIGDQDPGGDCADTSGENMLDDEGDNLDSDGSCTDEASSITANPRLEELDDNDGPTETHRLKANSPAIDEVPVNDCATIDQRGKSRPKNGDGTGQALCDIGAFELEVPDPQFCPGFNNDPRPQIIGTSANNTLNGGNQAEVICGKGGNDTIDGGGGDDVILGGEDNDTLRGKGGDDLVKGESGNDKILGGTGKDRLRGFSGTDEVNGEDGNDDLSGGADNDTMSGGGGDDDLGGWENDDTMEGNAGSDEMLGHTGHDNMDGGAGSDRVRGSTGNDKLFGREADDTLIGLSGNDLINGGPDTDVCHGGTGTNTLVACP